MTFCLDYLYYTAGMEYGTFSALSDSEDIVEGKSNKKQTLMTEFFFLNWFIKYFIIFILKLIKT